MLRTFGLRALNQVRNLVHTREWVHIFHSSHTCMHTMIIRSTRAWLDNVGGYILFCSRACHVQEIPNAGRYDSVLEFFSKFYSKSFSYDMHRAKTSANQQPLKPSNSADVFEGFCGLPDDPEQRDVYFGIPTWDFSSEHGYFMCTGVNCSGERSIFIRGPPRRC